jgi:predicted cytidylate kinase
LRGLGPFVDRPSDNVMMASHRSVVLNGDLGSGKTTVSMLLAERLGVRRISVGDLYRAMAAQQEMTALQINLHAELDDKIDHVVDQMQRDIAASGEQLVVDSRLAWHFFTDAMKVHLITEPGVAATRVLGRPAYTVERYESVEQARASLARRSASERQRFLTRYGVDKSRLHNYDLICDTTRAAPDEVVDAIVRYVRDDDQAPGVTVCQVDPMRIWPAADPSDADPIRVGYRAPHFFVVQGQSQLSAARRTGARLMSAVLVAEGTEDLAGTTGEQYVAEHVEAT